MLWVIINVTIVYLWLISYDQLVDCMIDPIVFVDWCLYQGAVYGWDATTYTPRPSNFDFYSTNYPESTIGAIYYIPLWIVTLLSVISYPMIMLFLKGCHTWHTNKRIYLGLCIKCGYNLKNNTSGICPECGTASNETQQPK